MSVAVLLAATAGIPAEPAPLPLSPDAWFGDPLAWEVTGNALHFSGERTALMEHRKSAFSGAVTVSVDVTVRRTVGSEWKIAAAAIVQDARNFWHIALVETPDGQGKRPTFELAEMRDGTWLAHNNLRLTARRNTGVAWQTGKIYRLTLVMDADGIEGRVSDTAGQTLYVQRRAFSGPAVTVGRPAVRCGGFEAVYQSLCAESGAPLDAPGQPDALVPYTAASFVPGIKARHTGFFRVEQHGDLWWVIDPLGRGFIPLGVDHVTYRGHWCTDLGFHPHERKNDARYSSREVWQQETLERLQGWGFNLLAAGCESRLRHRGLPHVIFLNMGSKMTDSGEAYYITPHEKRPCTAFPNVFHPQFEAFCRYEATRQCKPHAGDPWLFGYFLDNELAWWGRTWGDEGLRTGLFDAVMKLGREHTAKLALRDYLQKRFAGDIVACNHVFGVAMTSFDEIPGLSDLPGAEGAGPAVLDCKGGFARLVAETYFGTITRAIRAADPNHMILGSRFAGGRVSPEVWDVAGEHCGILSFNYYGNVDLDRGVALGTGTGGGGMGPPLPDVFGRFYEMGKRPMMITEWSFPALDAGLPGTKGAGQRFRTQAERAIATGIYAETILRMPFMVGYDYFMWVDEPALGITPEFPENSNYGLVNEDCEPYEELVRTFALIHRRAESLCREGLAGLPSLRTVAPRPDAATWLSSLREAGQGDSSGLHVTADGKRHVVKTKRFELRATEGGGMLTDQVVFDGVPLGRYNGMLQHWTGRRNAWTGVSRLAAVETSVDGGTLTVLLTGRGHGEAGASFAVTHRLTLFPDTPWFVAELVSVRNTGDRPLDMRGLFFRLHGAIGGSAEGDAPVAQNRAPRLWGRLPGDAWVDEKARVFWGAAVPPGADLRIHFWLNEHGGQHPDARREIRQVLRPSEEYCPEAPAFVLVVAGKGGAREWDEAVAEVLATSATTGDPK